jgi:hypothetical protein
VVGRSREERVRRQPSPLVILKPSATPHPKVPTGLKDLQATDPVAVQDGWGSQPLSHRAETVVREILQPAISWGGAIAEGFRMTMLLARLRLV